MRTQQGRPFQQGVLICDFGSQYTLLIARKLREQGVYAEIIAGTASQPPADFTFYGVILSGSPDSLGRAESRGLPAWVLSCGKPVLGICYGMQLLVSACGGRLRSGQAREYGRAELLWDLAEPRTQALLPEGMPAATTVWMSHGDDLERLPDDFVVLGRSDQGVVGALAHKEKPWVGLQFHPEVHHSQWGGELLQAFVRKLCGYEEKLTPACLLSRLIEGVQTEVGQGKVLLAVSGGVDSSVAAVLLHRALGRDKVVPVLVDHGLLRHHEAREVEQALGRAGVPLTVLARQELFLQRLEGVSDPEEKRKLIGRTFIECFEEFARHDPRLTHLGQGTLYPDVIESAGHGAGAHKIKSHHNVGGLPERLHLRLIEPFRYLFKDEVRRLGLELGLPQALVYRHPFPGPGLSVRIPGAVDREKIAILQQADRLFVEALKASGLYEKVWQAAAILLPVKSVGVMGDERTYQWACVLRAVTGVDAMTAEAAPLPMDFLTAIAAKIVREVAGINRVLYDVTSKPPATIEWE